MSILNAVNCNTALCPDSSVFTTNSLMENTNIVNEVLKTSCRIFVEPACSELDIVVTMTVQCMCVCPVCACVCPSEIARTITSTIVDGFEKKLTQLFSLMCRCAI